MTVIIQRPTTRSPNVRTPAELNVGRSERRHLPNAVPSGHVPQRGNELVIDCTASFFFFVDDRVYHVFCAISVYTNSP